MQRRSYSLLAAAVGGFLLATAVWLWLVPAPARAQFGGVGGAGIGVGAPLAPTIQTTALTPQPIEVQALDPMHFVVVTREPRLVRRINSAEPATNMIVPVVTYYTVSPRGLVPIEHVRVPPGWEALEFGPVN